MPDRIALEMPIMPSVRPAWDLINNLLSDSNIAMIIAAALDKGGEFAEIYAEYSVVNGLTLEENKIRQAQSGISQGVGIRVIHGEKTGYAYTENFELESLQAAAKTASYIADTVSPGELKKLDVTPWKIKNNSPIKIYPDSIDMKTRAGYLWKANESAHNEDKRVYQVGASVWDGLKIVVIANSLGILAGDQRLMIRFNVSALTEENGNKQMGYHGGGGRVGFEIFDKLTPEYFAKEAVRRSTIMLDAKEAPAGPQTVVLGNGWAGVLLHEAVGHGLEADFNRKGTSLYSGKVGQRVASELCSVADDGTLPNLRGSINIDDEGHPAERKILIENGILKGYMVDYLNSRLMGVDSTGSGRRESYKHYPIPRMTNTFLMAGQDDPGDIICSVKKGFYAKSFGGGEVDISNGQFVFQVTEGYMIEDGKITYPVKGATLIGSGPEVLQKLTMVGHDLEYDTGVGTCGKDGQSAPVGVGTPTCKISEITVGGTNIR